MRKSLSLGNVTPPVTAAWAASEPDSMASAEQPVSELQTFKDVQRWLVTMRGHVGNPDVQRVQEAVQILEIPSLKRKM